MFCICVLNEVNIDKPLLLWCDRQQGQICRHLRWPDILILHYQDSVAAQGGPKLNSWTLITPDLKHLAHWIVNAPVDGDTRLVTLVFSQFILLFIYCFMVQKSHLIQCTFRWKLIIIKHAPDISNPQKKAKPNLPCSSAPSTSFWLLKFSYPSTDRDCHSNFCEF